MVEQHSDIKRWVDEAVSAAPVYDLHTPTPPGPPAVVFHDRPAGARWVPIARDWDGDGRDTVAQCHPTTSVDYQRDEPAAGSAPRMFHDGPAAAGWRP